MKVLVHLILLTFPLIGKAQPPDANIWGILSDVQIEKEYDDMIGMEIIRPTFSPLITAMEGKEVVVKGYIIPLEGKKKQGHFMFSAFPYNMCFFCGKAGPESAMQVFTKKGKAVTYTEDAVHVKGILRLRRNDITGLIYALENAELVN
ncbi:MAG: DUF3299 domain-containing protein [Saprospiraceae bacterium]|jgi:hypothetical protein|nr:DUF3299 domain-containing protein [Saprospiraceae bacterium]